jgi:hypothetical protein
VVVTRLEWYTQAPPLPANFQVDRHVTAIDVAGEDALTPHAPSDSVSVSSLGASRRYRRGVDASQRASAVLRMHGLQAWLRDGSYRYFTTFQRLSTQVRRWVGRSVGPLIVHPEHVGGRTSSHSPLSA